MATSPYFFQAFRDPAVDLPADGGKVYIYAQGSAVRADIWLDAAETIPAPNPLMLDPAGVVQQYFVTDGQALDYKVFTSDGRTIVTALNVTANGNGGAEGGPFLPLAGEKRVSGWVAFDATVYGTLIDMRNYNLTQSGLELKTGTLIYGGGTLEIISSVYMDDPRALTLSIDSMGSGPGGVTPVNSTHLVGRDPVTGELVPVEVAPIPPDIDIAGTDSSGAVIPSPIIASGTGPGSLIGVRGENLASGQDAIALGAINQATAYQTAAIGTACLASATNAVAIGSYNVASANNAIAAGGDHNTSSGTYSFSSNKDNSAKGFSSFVSGMGNVGHYAQTVFGKYAEDDEINDSAATAGQKLLKLGIGAYGAPHKDGFWVDDTGKGCFAGGLQGTTTNDSAPAGCVGELLSSIVPIGSHVSLTTGVAQNLTYLDLTPGDWLVSAVNVFDPAGTASYSTPHPTTSLSIVSATPDLVFAANGNYGGGWFVRNTLPPDRPIKVASGTTTRIYLVVLANFSGGTSYIYGNLYARRVR